MTSIKKPRKRYIIVLLVVTLGAIAYFIVANRGPNLSGMHTINGYDPNGICQANLPQCGVCPGTVYADQCYVKDD